LFWVLKTLKKGAVFEGAQFVKKKGVFEGIVPQKKARVYWKKFFLTKKDGIDF